MSLLSKMTLRGMFILQLTVLLVTSLSAQPGTEKWTFPTGGAVQGSPAIGPEGVIYAGSQIGNLYAINPDGTEKWRFAVGQPLLEPPAIVEDGTIYAAANDGTLYALNPDGSLQWKVALDAQITAGPSIAVNGDLYVPIDFKSTQGMNKGLLLALDSTDGSELWRYETDGGVSAVPAVGLDGTIYLATTAHKLIALRPDGTELWVFDPGGTNRTARSFPTIAENGTLYYGSSEGQVYAVSGSSAGPAASDWAMARRDVRNTGRSGSNIARRRFFAPHVYDLTALELGNSVLIMHHTGDIPAGPAGIGTTANFRIDVRNRDGSLLFSMDESVEPGETKDIVLTAPDSAVYQGSVVVDAPIKDGIVLAPFLTWVLDLGFNAPLQIGASFFDPTDAAQMHYFPAEASASNGLGIGIQNIGENEISCDLDFLNEDGTPAGQEVIPLDPLGSFVDFFVNIR